MFRKMLSKTILDDLPAARESKKILEAARAINIDQMPPFLSDSQRDYKRVKALAKSVDQLSELECANLLSNQSEISPRTAEIVSLLASLDKPHAANPTKRLLLDSVAQSVSQERPLEMFASLCLEKGPGLRDGKLQWFLRGERLPTPETLATSVCLRGWKRVREIMEKIDYPITVTFLLGDLDYAVVDGCRDWCQPNWQDILASDTDRILKDTQQQAAAFFGPGKDVRIKKWSSVYTASEILTQLPRAEFLLKNTESSSIMKDSLKMYKQQWGYSSLARQLGIGNDQLESFILGDVQRMSAQYRVEADYVKLCNGIQLWCEAVPNPGWPIQLSNFDGSGYVASLIME